MSVPTARGGPDRPELLAAFVAGRDRLVSCALAAGPDARVPMSSRWTVPDLVVHAGNVHAWAAEILRSGVEQPQAFEAEPASVAAGFASLVQWYADRADALLDLLVGGAVPDETTVWTFGPPATAAFWPRRQSHEVTMHALDAALAAGEPVSDAVLRLDPRISADGVDEVFTVMMPRIAGFLPRPSMPGPLAVQALDTGDVWVLAPDGQMDSAATASDVAATLSGPASAVFALLWRRATLDQSATALSLEVDGDRGVLDGLFAARLTP
jgi:uncharacterized protein (TIGR03083 family)